jgi:hypothetical protein
MLGQKTLDRCPHAAHQTRHRALRALEWRQSGLKLLLSGRNKCRNGHGNRSSHQYQQNKMTKPPGTARGHAGKEAWGPHTPVYKSSLNGL